MSCQCTFGLEPVSSPGSLRRYTRYMLASNPSMLDTTKPFPSDWVAVPDLNSFVTASNTTASDPVYGGDPVSASSPGPSASGTTNSSGNGTGAGLADAKPSTGGESESVRVESAVMHDGADSRSSCRLHSSWNRGVFPCPDGDSASLTLLSYVSCLYPSDVHAWYRSAVRG
jgi:hypothetical protein